MDCKKIYDKIVKRGRDRVLTGYQEMHHIVPRCMGGSNDATNLVSLTPEEHYLCHLLLVRMHPGNIALVRAAMFMAASNSTQQRNNKQYGWLKRQYSTYMSGPNNPQKLNPRSGVRHHTYNRKINFNFTDKGRKVLSDKMKGEKNPCSGLKPWDHPRATEYSRSIWLKAGSLYNLWLLNDKPSYAKLFYIDNGKCYTTESKVIGPYMNIIKYFKSGWIPEEDEQWKDYVKRSI